MEEDEDDNDMKHSEVVSRVKIGRARSDSRDRDLGKKPKAAVNTEERQVKSLNVVVSIVSGYPIGMPCQIFQSPSCSSSN